MGKPLFSIEIQDASGNAVGDRPITSALRISRRRCLDKIGGLQFSLPATDPVAQYIRTGRRFVVTHRHLGNLGTFIYKNERLALGESPTLDVDCWDDLKELVDTNVLLFREYSATAVDTVVSSLLALASGWGAGDVETGIGNTTVSYHGESLFIAIDALRDRWGRHYRRGTTAKTLDFGSFGTDSGVRLIPHPSAPPPETETNTQEAFVTSLEVAEESEAVFNSLIPLGAGEGKAQLDLENADQPASTILSFNVAAGDTILTLDDASSFAAGDILYIDDAGSLEALEITDVTGSVVTIDPAPDETGLYYDHAAGTTVYASYKVLSTTNADSSTLYYIEDPTSVRLYGTVRRPFAQSGIRPISNTVANIANAANALRLTASYYLKKNRFPRTTYAVEVTKLRDTGLKPGDKVRLQYRGVAQVPGENEYKWVDVDSLHYVMDIEEVWDDGTESARLELSETGYRRTADSDVTLGLARELEVKSIHPGVYTFVIHDTRLELIDSSTPVTVPVDIDSSILRVRSVKIRLKTAPLRATATAAQSATHTHPGESADSTTHSHPGEAADSNTHSHPGEAADSNTHSHPGEAANSNDHNHTAQATDSADHSHPGEASNSTGGPSYQHFHYITLDDSVTGDTVRESGGNLRVDGGASVSTGTADLVSHSHTIDIGLGGGHTHPINISDDGAHTHVVNIGAGGAHTHVVNIGAGGAHTHVVNIGAGGAHAHDVNIGEGGAHTHDLTYGIYEETGVRPQEIFIAIDGIDRTAALGGTWGDAGEAVNEELDITTYIVNSALGLRAEHSVVFTCSENQGRIETVLRAVMDAQSIAVS